jgi:shikimate dehydrogenase
MRISGHTKPFAVLGHPIGHTLSPVMHNAAFAALGLDAVYLALDVAPERLLPALTSLRDLGFGGVNLTVPLKEVAFRGLPRLDDSARLLGAVNTVTFTADGLTGYNTDGHGFLAAIEEAFAIPVAGQRLFILGAGGAGRAVALVSAREGAASITLTDIDGARAVTLAREVEALGTGASVRLIEPGHDPVEPARACDLIVQSTPVGMKKDDRSPLNPAAFRPGQRVFDLVYMYPETALLAEARKAGAQIANGLGMLLHQGARAFSIWTGRESPLSVMREALVNAVYPTPE